MSESHRPRSHSSDKPKLNDEKRYSGKTGRDTNSNDANALRRRLFIGNLATDKTSKAEIEEIFAQFGEVESCSLHNNFGFVQFARGEDADKAVLEMHGKTLFGKRIDANLAGMRRKTQSKDKYDAPPIKEEVVPENMRDFGAKRPRPRSRSPIRDASRPLNDYDRSLSPMSRYEEFYRRDDPYTRPRDPYVSGFDGPRNSYSEYRDNYYPPRYEREYPPQRDDPYFRPQEVYNRLPPARVVRPSIDCEIVALSKEESRYADEVESRLRSIGLVCNIGFPAPELPVADVIERIARAGTLYAIVVAAQNAQHRSCTLNILHGTRQEHRNMPLDHALSFVARNFDSYLKSLRDPYYGAQPVGSYAPRNDSRSYVPPSTEYRFHSLPESRPLATNEEKKLSNEELTEMLEKLKREKEERDAEAGYGINGSSSGYYDTQYR